MTTSTGVKLKHNANTVDFLNQCSFVLFPDSSKKGRT